MSVNVSYKKQVLFEIMLLVIAFANAHPSIKTMTVNARNVVIAFLRACAWWDASSVEPPVAS